METLEEKSLYDEVVYQQCLERINELTANTTPQWGKMSAAQMLSHCAEIQEVSNGKSLENTPFIIKLIKGVIRNMVVNHKPYKHSTKTHPQYRQQDPRDFELEKIRLLAALEQFQNDKAEGVAHAHPLFGPMTENERGWAMYKHLDYHLTQFGV